MGIAETFIYKSIYRYSSSYRLTSTLPNVNSYDKYIRIDVNQSVVEVPLFCFSNVVNGIPDLQQNTSIFVSLPQVPTFQTKPTSSGALTCFLRDNILAKVKLKNEYYYGTKGLILNKDRQILFMLSVSIDMSCPPIRLIGVKAYVSPLVYQNQANAIENLIIKKFIPVCISDPLNNPYTVFFTNKLKQFNNNISYNIPVIIDNCSKFVESPKRPNTSDLDEEKVNQFLKKHVRDFIL